MLNSFRLFGMNATAEYANKVAQNLGVELSKHTERWFPDREPYVKSDVNVRNCDVYIIQSLYQSDHESLAEKFSKLLFFIGSLKDASVRRITAVIPYLSYSRQDRKTESRSPITTKYVAQLLEAVGVDRLLTMDVHNLSAFQNAFRIPVDNLEAKNLIADYVSSVLKNVDKELTVLSTDSGGMDRTRKFRDVLQNKLEREIDIAYLDKTHIADNIFGNEIIGNISNRLVLAIDDMISSGKTLLECQKAINKKGLKNEFWACSTHALFVGAINENIRDLRKLIITDTISRTNSLNKDMLNKCHIISTTNIFAQAIKRIHEEGGSISDLLK